MLTTTRDARGATWWDDAKLEAAASTSCGYYDIVGTILQYSGGRRLTRHFAKHWGKSIIANYEILRDFLELRRAAGGNEYQCFHWLYRQALKQWPRVTVGAFPPSRPQQVAAEAV